eukprot:4003387-Pleurochrysis_carterae.AAC.1
MSGSVGALVTGCTARSTAAPASEPTVELRAGGEAESILRADAQLAAEPSLAAAVGAIVDLSEEDDSLSPIDSSAVCASEGSSNSESELSCAADAEIASSRPRATVDVHRVFDRAEHGCRYVSAAAVFGKSPQFKWSLGRASLRLAATHDFMFSSVDAMNASGVGFSRHCNAAADANCASAAQSSSDLTLSPLPDFASPVLLEQSRGNQGQHHSESSVAAAAERVPK